MFEVKLLRGGKPPVDGPLDHAEAYYILEGEVTFKADGQTLPAREGLVHLHPRRQPIQLRGGGGRRRGRC